MRVVDQRERAGVRRQLARTSGRRSVSLNESTAVAWRQQRGHGAVPRLRLGVDVAAVGSEQGEELVCLYDRQDPSAGQVVVTRAGVFLASLLDGARTLSGVRAAFALRSGLDAAATDLAAFVDQLDQAYLLDSPRYRGSSAARRRRVPARSGRGRPSTRAAPTPASRRRCATSWTSRYTVAGGPGRRPGPVSHPSRRALIAPHIDLHRGGHSYAWGYRALAESEPAELYVLLGTCHQPMRRPFAATALAYDTPFGPVTGDPDVPGAAPAARAVRHLRG